MWAIDNISNYSANATLRDGTAVRVRAIRPNDKERLARHFDGLGCDSRYHRFFGIKNGLTPLELRYFTEPDFLRHVALVVTVISRDGQETIVSDGRYVALPGCGSMAELALSVVDTHQRKGIGSLLLECLIGLAQHLRLDRLEADVLASNRGAVRFLIRRGFKSTLTSGGVCHVAMSVEDHHGDPSIAEGHPTLGRGRTAPYQPSLLRGASVRKRAEGLASRRGRVTSSRRIAYGERSQSFLRSLRAEGDRACPYELATTSTPTRSWKDGACRAQAV
jgi:GNAT superfamily N-acetyltransferase